VQRFTFHLMGLLQLLEILLELGLAAVVDAGEELRIAAAHFLDELGEVALQTSDGPAALDLGEKDQWSVVGELEGREAAVVRHVVVRHQGCLFRGGSGDGGVVLNALQHGDRCLDGGTPEGRLGDDLAVVEELGHADDAVFFLLVADDVLEVGDPHLGGEVAERPRLDAFDGPDDRGEVVLADVYAEELNRLRDEPLRLPAHEALEHQVHDALHEGVREVAGELGHHTVQQFETVPFGRPGADQFVDDTKDGLELLADEGVRPRFF